MRTFSIFITGVVFITSAANAADARSSHQHTTANQPVKATNQLHQSQRHQADVKTNKKSNSTADLVANIDISKFDYMQVTDLSAVKKKLESAKLSQDCKVTKIRDFPKSAENPGGIEIVLNQNGDDIVINLNNDDTLYFDMFYKGKVSKAIGAYGESVDRYGRKVNNYFAAILDKQGNIETILGRSEWHPEALQAAATHPNWAKSFLNLNRNPTQEEVKSVFPKASPSQKNELLKATFSCAADQ